MIQKFQANGKLLLSGEYFVLDGALALALPTKLGQSLQVTTNQKLPKVLHWKSYNIKQEIWFEAVFKLPTLQILQTSDKQIGQRLQHILQVTQQFNLEFLRPSKGILVKTNLEFPNNWGLGTSSTLIYNIAKWANVDAFELLENTMGGSGYDIACAGADKPIVYQKLPKPTFKAVPFNPVFTKQLYFVHLGKKQNSREGIARYRQQGAKNETFLKKISTLTQALLEAQTLTIFEKLLVEHEKIVASVIQLPRAKALYFKDYWGVVKSLGAWGGDFVLATSTKSEKETKQYFENRGFTICLPYRDLIL